MSLQVDLEEFRTPRQRLKASEIRVIDAEQSRRPRFAPFPITTIINNVFNKFLDAGTEQTESGRRRMKAQAKLEVFNLHSIHIVGAQTTKTGVPACDDTRYPLNWNGTSIRDPEGFIDAAIAIDICGQDVALVFRGPASRTSANQARSKIIEVQIGNEVEKIPLISFKVWQAALSIIVVNSKAYDCSPAPLCAHAVACCSDPDICQWTLAMFGHPGLNFVVQYKYRSAEYKEDGTCYWKAPAKDIPPVYQLLLMALKFDDLNDREIEKKYANDEAKKAEKLAEPGMVDQICRSCQFSESQVKAFLETPQVKPEYWKASPAPKRNLAAVKVTGAYRNLIRASEDDPVVMVPGYFVPKAKMTRSSDQSTSATQGAASQAQTNQTDQRQASQNVPVRNATTGGTPASEAVDLNEILFS